MNDAAIALGRLACDAASALTFQVAFCYNPQTLQQAGYSSMTFALVAALSWRILRR
jgi:hypothetical protein